MHERLDPRDLRTLTLIVGVLLGWVSLVAIAGGGGAGEWIFRTTPAGPGIADGRTVNPTVRERGELMVGGSSLDGSAVLARESPLGVGGNAPDGTRRTIAVATDGAVAIFTSGDLVAVDVRDHLATAAANSAVISSEVMVIAGQSGGTVRAIATDATGGLAIQDSGGSLTVDAPVGTPVFTRLSDGAAAQGTVANPLLSRASDGVDAQLITAAGELNVLATAQPGVDIGDVTINNAAGAAAVNVQDGGNVLSVDDAAGSLTTDTPQLPAALVGGRLDVVVGAALPAGANNIGDVDVLTLPALVAGTATVGSMQVLGLVTATGARPALRMEADGTAIVSGTMTSVAGASTATIGSVQVINGAGGLAVNIQDGGNALSVDDNAGSLTTDTPQLPAALVGGRLDVVVGAALPAGANNIGDVDVLTLPALIAGTATIGSVQALGLAADGTRPALRVSTTGSVAIQDDGGSITTDTAQLPAALVGGRLDVVVGAALPAGANNIGDVDVITLPALVAGTATVGSVQVLGLASDGTRPAVRTGTDGTVRVDPTGTTAQPVTDNAGSLTVDAPLATPVAVRIGDTVDAANVTAAGELNVLASAQPGVDIGDVTLTASTATIGTTLALGSMDYVMVAGTNFLVQTAFTNFVTSSGGEEREIVAAQGGQNSILVLGFVVTTDNAVKVAFENGAAGTRLSLPVRLGSDGSGWTADYRAAWFETSDNQSLELDTNALMTGACQVWYVVK